MPNLELTFESGESSLTVRRFAVHEGISSLFVVTIWALSDDASIDLDTIVGKYASFHAESGAAFASLGGERHWAGICAQMALVKAEPSGRSTYQLRIVPTMWLLTQRRGHRIFQHLSIPDIVDQLLAEWSIAPTWNVDRARYPKLEYKVQYGESDYDLVCRLLEEVGIAFTFPEDATDVSRLTFADELHAGDPRAMPLDANESALGNAGRELASRVHLGHDVRPGAHTVRDYDSRNPSFALLGKAQKAEAPEDRYEQFEYQPGSFLVESENATASADTPLLADDKGIYRYDQGAGDNLAQRSLEGARIQKRAVTFDTNSVDLWPGMVFSIENHPHPELGGAAGLLVTGFFVEGAPGEDWHMSGNAVFTAAPYRPPATTPKPRVHSVQSATVVGPSGQEIHTDEFGRVRVQLPWDREGKSDDDSSVWMRVSQEWAGTGFGMITIPRIGQEVLIGFLGGDPDQPIVVGRLFNKTHPVPYKLPSNKTQSGWRTDTSPGSEGLNTIQLEDLAGSELVYQQAEKKLRRLVKNDETITVGNDRDKGVAADETDTTVGDRVEETDKDRLEQIVGERTTVAEKKLAAWVKGDEIERTLGTQLVRIGKDQHLTVKKTKRELDHLDLHLHVKGSRNEQVGAYSLSTSSQQEKIGKKDELETGLTLHAKAGTVLVAEGASSVTIKGPGGFITIGPGGIDIVGTLVMINEGGSEGSAPDAKPAGPEAPKQGDIVPVALKLAPPPPPQVTDKAPPPPPPPPPPKPVTPVNPVITPKDPAKIVVVVRKFATNLAGVKVPYTTPARKALHLTTDAPFTGTGTFTCPGGKVKFFSASKGGVEIKFDGKDNVFAPGATPAWAGTATLSGGVTVFAEGATPSGTLEDITAELRLSGGPRPVGLPATKKLTSVEVTLDICKSRPAPATDPPVFTQDDKVFLGRNLLVQDAAKHFERAQLIIKEVKPGAFKGDLVLTAKNAHVTAFKDEKPHVAPGEAAVLPFTIAADKIPVGGEKLWAQGVTASADMRDSGFVLGIKGVEPDGNRVTATAVQILLDICHSRTKKTVLPTPLSADNKVKIGRFVHEQDTGNHHGRALLVVRKVKPDKFDGTLVLESLGATTELFPNEDAKVVTAVTPVPHEINYKAEKNEDKPLWVQGKTVSAGLRLAGYVLHLKEDNKTNADTILMTVCKFTDLTADIPRTPERTNRYGNSPVARHPYVRSGAVADHFDEDYKKNLPFGLVEDSVRGVNPVKLSVKVAPAGVKVLWSVLRDTRPAPDGDHASVAALGGPPTHRADGAAAADPLKREMLANGVGTFHIRAFVDCNGSGKYEQHIDSEPHILMIAILFHVKGHTNTSIKQDTAATNNAAAITGAAGGVPSSANGVGVTTGDFNLRGALVSGANDAVHQIATVTVIGGGDDGLRGLDPAAECLLFAGWMNNELDTGAVGEDAVASYLQTMPPVPNPPGPPIVPPPVPRSRVSVRVNPAARPPRNPLTRARDFIPGGLAAPGAWDMGPVLDTSINATAGTGGNTVVGTEGAIGPPIPIVKVPGPGAKGQRWTVEMWDSPGDSAPSVQGGFPNTRLVAYRFNLNFRTDLVFWTNTTHAPAVSGANEPAHRLYSSVQTNTWNIRAALSFNAAGVAIAPPARATVSIGVDGDPKRKATPLDGQPAETRGPQLLSMLAIDART